MPKRIDEGLRAIFAGARRHGEVSSELDHEVGDLQDALKLAWACMAPRQRRTVRSEWLKLRSALESDDG